MSITCNNCYAVFWCHARYIYAVWWRQYWNRNKLWVGVIYGMKGGQDTIRWQQTWMGRKWFICCCTCRCTSCVHLRAVVLGHLRDLKLWDLVFWVHLDGRMQPVEVDDAGVARNCKARNEHPPSSESHSRAQKQIPYTPQTHPCIRRTWICWFLNMGTDRIIYGRGWKCEVLYM